MASTVAAFTHLARTHPDHGPALFELANALDADGQEALAERHYRQALDLGITGDRQRRCVVQLASTLTELGKPDDVLLLLVDVGAEHPEWAEVGVFRAIAEHRAGRPNTAVAQLLSVITEHNGNQDLDRYRAAWREAVSAIQSSEHDSVE
ncbi:tetratricopeptide repeat protein [Rhodococcus sp. NBC_00297]|uniref:tetratricopeptide repeat protein n=1 Tax=Rhodococcus sp. NBC_00297 TaxID=2976005 RepID=UPI002E2A93EC|nr:tetratricopeptide repeat protein [Rhodococcus sp. NBC_00297]